MRDVKTTPGRNVKQGFPTAPVLAWVCLIALVTARAGTETSTRETASAMRLLTVAEGHSIVDAAWEWDQSRRGTQDCSHLVHQIYLNAGFAYPYGSSFEIYAGHKNFARVKYPRAGDLIAWRGHVGIVLDPSRRTFYSRVSTGLEAQDYEAPYWKSRGVPRFYRYRVDPPGALHTAEAAVSPKAVNLKKGRTAGPVLEERPFDLHQLPDAAAERAAMTDAPPALKLNEAAPAFEIPSSILVAAGTHAPTRWEVAEGISELSDAMGSALRVDDSLEGQLPVVIIEQFTVDRVDIDRNHGWARLEVDSRMSIGNGTPQLNRRREKISWELRRTESGWEVLAPPDRVYVPHDEAVRNLAAQLARLTASDGATVHQEAVLRREAQLASLLGALLEGK